MAGLSDILTTIQNGVTALNNLGSQVSGSFNNIASQLAVITPSSGIVTSIAGNSGAFTLNGASGLTNTINDIKLSPASTSQFGSVKVDGVTVTAAAGVISAVTPASSHANLSPITASTSADILLNNIATYFDGPSVAQGSSGTWFASGTVTITDTATGQYDCKLWDGTTVIASARSEVGIATAAIAISLSGYIASPAANLKISVKPNVTTATMRFNQSGNSKDSTITAIRIA